MNPYRKFIYSTGPWLILAIALNLLRLYMVEVPSYIYMNWNVFLGLLPVACAWLFEYKKRYTIVSLLFFLAWLLLLPNAPYMITDFIHLRDVGTASMLWYDGFMLFAYALVGVHAFAFSLYRVHQQITSSALFIWIISLLSGFGIYLGRYVRWNTWDIIINGKAVLQDISHIIGNILHEPLISITIMVFMCGMVVSYYSYCNSMKP